MKIIQNRKKYKFEAKGKVTTIQRFRRMIKIHIREGDPILTMNYAKYYLNVIDEGVERKRFFTEVDLCRIHISQIYQRKQRGLIGIDPKKMAQLQAKYSLINLQGGGAGRRHHSPSEDTQAFNKSNL